MMTRRTFLGLGLAAGATGSAPASSKGAIAATRGKRRQPTDGPAPDGLMCELLAMPERTQITAARPKFSWIVNSDLQDDLQTAYHIRMVAGTAPDGERPVETFWDTGKVTSDQSTAVPYGGSPLQSHSVYGWHVRTWNKRGQASAWSAVQTFTTGTLRPAEERGADLAGRLTVARYPIEQTDLAPVLVVPVGAGHFFLDFGRDAFGALLLTLTSRAGGETVRLHMGEALDGPARVSRTPPGSVRYHGAVLTLRPGTHEYVVPLDHRDARCMPAEVGPVMPFRYAEVENPPSDLRAELVRQRMAHYPFEDGAAHFDSSDEGLNAVWELCQYTIKATSFCGVYVDGDRERKPYEADAYINQLGHYCCDREFTLARYSHEYLILNPTWPTEWILQSVLMAWSDYLHTGDLSSVAEFYDDLKAKTLFRLAREDGLISTTQPPVPPDVLASVHSPEMRDIVDWPIGERDGYDLRPVNTVVNAFHCRALVLMAHIAQALGRTEDAVSFHQRAGRTTQALNAVLFDPKSGLYLDGEGSGHSSLHANMFALAFGLVPPERAATVVNFVRDKGMACSVYGAQYLLEACYAAGLADYALALMTSRMDRSWLHMIRDVGTTLTTEAWDQKDKPNQDWNHAWGAAPANIIPRLLMGVQPLEPGFRTVQIRPQPGGLAHASLVLPTIRGTVRVKFESSPERFVLDVGLPANMTTQVSLPALGSDDPTVIVDGSRRPGRREGGFVVLDRIGSGVHRLERRL